MPTIGPTFGAELKTAGVPLDGILWCADGAIDYNPTVTDAVKAQVQAVLDAHNPLAVPVPQSVQSVQAKIQLHRAGLLDQVKTAVAADPEIQLWYDNALTWELTNTYVVSLGTKLGLTSSQIADLFTAASAIK